MQEKGKLNLFIQSILLRIYGVDIINRAEQRYFMYIHNILYININIITVWLIQVGKRKKAIDDYVLIIQSLINTERTVFCYT